MLSAWMLDEASGNRVNAQGTAARDLSASDGTDPPGSTDRQEGARSISITAAQARHTSDTFPGLVSPLSLGCWFKMAANPTAAAAFIMHHFQDGVAGTTKLNRGTSGAVNFSVYDSGGALKAVNSGVVTNNAWHHAVGTAASGGQQVLYVDGVQAVTAGMTTMSASGNPFYVGDNFLYTGLVDECFVANLQLSAAAVCRICSCGLRGEQCSCSGTAFTSTGRNASACGSCTLPADCSASTPP
jgi:hypothetical protein